MPEFTPNNLISGRLLTRNTLLNFVGQASPLVTALFAIPWLVAGLGVNRFGVLTLGWIIIGYFSLFDLGLGRALTKLVADKLATGRGREIPPLAWTALFLMLLSGLVGTVVLGLLSLLLVRDVLKIPEMLQSETLHTFYLLAVAIPVVVSTAGLRGILEAYQRFDLVTAVRIPSTTFNYLGPLLVLPFSQSLVPAVSVLVAGRLLFWLIHLLLCFRVVPALRNEISLQRTAIRPLLHFGGWLTVSNLVWPLMTYMDRFLIGAWVSVTAVAYYATPYEMVTKLWLVPFALIGVLFPAFTTSLIQDRARVALLLDRGVKYVFLVLFPLVLRVLTLANEGLNLWLGADFAQNSARVLQLLAVGILVSSMALVATTMIQGIGRPDLAAKLQLAELPFYLLLLWWLLSTFGIEGAAFAWVVRVVVEAAVLFYLSQRFLPTRTKIVRRTTLILLTALLTLTLAALLADLAIKGLFLSITLPAFALAAWSVILTPAERSAIRKHLKLATHSVGGNEKL